jgi:hypothetical protein
MFIKPSNLDWWRIFGSSRFLINPLKLWVNLFRDFITLAGLRGVIRSSFESINLSLKRFSGCYKIDTQLIEEHVFWIISQAGTMIGFVRKAVPKSITAEVKYTTKTLVSTCLCLSTQSLIKGDMIDFTILIISNVKMWEKFWLPLGGWGWSSRCSSYV